MMPAIDAGGRTFYEASGQGGTALLFVHGWLGSSRWWDEQASYFGQWFSVLRLDLPGHGKSAGMAPEWSAEGYAGAINAVVRHSGAQDVIVVAHSMAGAYALLAALDTPAVSALILVDTLKNLDQLMRFEDAQAGILALYRKDFVKAVREVLPGYLFGPATPEAVKERLLDEFLQVPAAHAIEVIEPLYKMDIPTIARRVSVPVRAINSTFTPSAIEVNRRHLADYACVAMEGTGHYPMLENPAEFNRLLASLLAALRPASEITGNSATSPCGGP